MANHGARPGVKRLPLTPKEIAIVQMLSEGFEPRELAKGPSRREKRAMWSRIAQIRLKLDAFTTTQMVLIAYKNGLIK